MIDLLESCISSVRAFSGLWLVATEALGAVDSVAFLFAVRRATFADACSLQRHFLSVILAPIMSSSMT